MDLYDKFVDAFIELDKCLLPEYCIFDNTDAIVIECIRCTLASLLTHATGTIGISEENIRFQNSIYVISDEAWKMREHQNRLCRVRHERKQLLAELKNEAIEGR